MGCPVYGGGHGEEGLQHHLKKSFDDTHGQSLEAPVDVMGFTYQKQEKWMKEKKKLLTVW